jgi:hypothetical protein
MPNILIAKATAALQESVASILACDENDATKREALAETFSQFEDYLKRNGVGSDIAKARDRHDVGGRGLAAATSELALDLIRHHRRRLGLVAKGGGQPEESNMRCETLESILKDSSAVSVCKAIVDRGRSPCGEHELVTALTKAAAEQFNMPGDRAFAKLCESSSSVLRACSIAKAAEFSVFDIEPVVVGGPGAMNEANDAEQSAVLRATKEIQRIGREKFPFLSADQQFARIFEDKNYEGLARQAHSRPTAPAGGAYAFPTAVAKSDHDFGVPNDSAYAALMRKAEEYRNAHPDLSIAQCFEKIYTDRGNIELAKRERIESLPR